MHIAGYIPAGRRDDRRQQMGRSARTPAKTSRELSRKRLPVFAELHTISARDGKGIGALLKSVDHLRGRHCQAARPHASPACCRPPWSSSPHAPVWCVRRCVTRTKADEPARDRDPRHLLAHVPATYRQYLNISS
jgi:hypothetical protein